MAELALVVWSRPWAFALLVVPLVALLLARRPGIAVPLPTATVALWRELAELEVASHSRARRRPPRSLLLLLLAMVAAILAMAGPRVIAPAVRTDVYVLLDRSPSMFLPEIGASETGARASGATRIERALELAERFLDERALAPDRRVWVCVEQARELRSRGALPPPAWLDVPAGEPVWTRWDRDDVLWVSDSSERPALAAACWSGAESTPGPVAARWDGEAHVLSVWDGRTLREQPYVGGAPRVCTREVGEQLSQWIGIWAAHRGFALERCVERPAEGLVLSVLGSRADAAASSPAEREIAASMEGWSATFQGCSLAPAPSDAESSWLAARDGTQLVRTRAGQVLLGFTDCRPAAGTEEAFAVSWAELFDRVARPLPGVVALRERAHSGPPGGLDWSDAARSTRSELAARWWPAASLALLACLAAIGCCLDGVAAFRRFGPREPHRAMR